MKYRDPRTGDVFEDIEEVYVAYCERQDCCCDCNIWSKLPTCRVWAKAHPAEAARLMGLEVVEDEEIERRYGKMELKNTIEMMNSEDYKERFAAEYWQAKIRYEKLHKMCIKYEAGTLPFTPSCSLELLLEQKQHMGNYLKTLEIRAEIEEIDLNV